MNLLVSRENGVPLYVQICTQLREMITSGKLRAGDRLPANRHLAKILGVNRTTVTAAYSELEADGFIDAHIGRGTFVSAVSNRAAGDRHIEAEQPSPMIWSSLLTEQPRGAWLGGLPYPEQNGDIISLAYGLPPSDLFPIDDFRRSVDRVLRREGRSVLQLGATAGHAPFREYIASQMSISGVPVTPEEILITNGCQQSLDLLRRILVAPGDEIAIEEPTYPGAIGVFCGNKDNYFTVPVLGTGLDIKALAELLTQRRPKLIYTTPTFHNPTGSTLDTPSRRRLIELAVKHRIPIIEDDIYRELHYEGPLPPSLKALDRSGIVISLNSFSKVGFPGLRVGWIAAPRPVIERLISVKRNCDLHANLLAQAAIYEFSKHGLLAKHIKRVRRAYLQRRDAMIEALENHLPEEARWSRPAGGMVVWVELPPYLNANEILSRSAERGVIFAPGDHFYPGPAPQNMMRLCFTIAAPPAIETAISHLGDLIKARMRNSRERHAPMERSASTALV